MPAPAAVQTALAAPPPLPSVKPPPPPLRPAAAAPPPVPAPPPPADARPAPPAPLQEARIPAAPRAAELRACPPPGTRIQLSVGDTLSFGNARDFVCDLGLGIPDRQMLAFVAGPDPRRLVWQTAPPKLPLAPGSRFAFISEGFGDYGTSSWYHDFVVKGPARIATKAGAFDVVVIEEARSGWNGNEYEARLRHYWSPALGFVVKQEVLEETSNRTNFRSPHNRGGPAYGPLGRASWEAVSVLQP